MKTKEIIEREICGDSRVYRAMQEAKRTDKSFTDKGLFGFPIKYSQSECRKFWFDAMELGMMEGLRIGSIQGQKIDLFNNCKEPRQKEFLEKFYKLAEEYNCAIAYHPIDGMTVIDLKNHYKIYKKSKVQLNFTLLKKGK
jgi:hypothetical protein